MVEINLNRLKQSYGTNLKTETVGQWFDLSLVDGVSVKVARAGNPEYKKLLKKLYKPYAKQLQRGKNISQDIEDNIQNTLLLKTLLKDWKGMPGENGKDVPYSEKAAEMLIKDPELKELKEEILSFSEEFEAFQSEIDEELEKN